ncbi:MAG: DUF58 domain-containing protein [Gammaproteobacteria bacterium]|nr:DUF58 domain-containing protein [Gammaproteobacteria bacterium]
MRVDEFHYRLNWRASGALPGHHRSAQLGDGVDLYGHAPLYDRPDPRRIDLRASLRDPMQQLLVRVFRQRGAVPVYALADLSASMGFNGHSRKLDVMAEFIASLGYSAYRSGDPFAFIGCNSVVLPDFYHPLSRAKAAGADVAQRLLDLVPSGAGSDGLLRATGLVGHRRALVFLVSDFHFPLALLSQVLHGLGRHQIVPVVLTDRMEYETLPTFGFVRVLDPESGRQRSMLMRRTLRQRVRSAFRQHFDDLERVFAAHGTEALWMGDAFRADEVTRYFNA